MDTSRCLTVVEAIELCEVLERIVSALDKSRAQDLNEEIQVFKNKLLRE